MSKAVLFGLWGGVVTAHPLQPFHKFETCSNIPRDLISNASDKGCGENALVRAERGIITLSQMFAELETECGKEAVSQSEPKSLPAPFSAQKLSGERGGGIRKVEISTNVLDTAATLKRNGIKTGIVANIWVDDSPQRDSVAKMLSVLESCFDVVVQSCHIGSRLPEPEIFHTALAELNVKPHESIWLDVNEKSVQAAESLGMKAVKITGISEALMEIEKFTEIKVTTEQQPLCCNPEEISHGYVTIKPGVKIHFVEMGDGPPVLLCHGFPESWFSWRYQIPALANAGFKAIAIDLKGFGDSSTPADIAEYSQENILRELVTFLDRLGLAQVTVVGHDWGGVIAWNMALYYPERLRAVASLNTPLFPVDPNKNPMQTLKSIPVFEYQIYFQEPGVAEAELEKNLERTFKLLFTASYENDTHPQVDLTGVIKRGGLFVGMPEEVPRSAILSEAELQYYIQQYRKSGFRGPLNLYRNGERNWRWMCSRPRGKILMPALMVTAGKDKVLLPIFSTGMEKIIPNLSRAHLENCGHWTQMERPAETNKILISWLKEIHQENSIPFYPKL
ncbi:bifunctional epoxide hydrolase 2 [Ictalurus punctatus]|uniref:Bifunctional epoxide hydrolase 2 n=1 Tax=Ictalurus punctatus TaxID=7998 RepID=A0A2D0RPH2_ICTPU|nr:bifunctional epoxide hydrolase 2 [Ictalurus punctatus]